MPNFIFAPGDIVRLRKHDDEEPLHVGVIERQVDEERSFGDEPCYDVIMLRGGRLETFHVALPLVTEKIGSLPGPVSAARAMLELLASERRKLDERTGVLKSAERSLREAQASRRAQLDTFVGLRTIMATKLSPALRQLFDVPGGLSGEREVDE